MEYISTTSLSNELEIPTNELFNKLKNLGWIDRKNDKWTLTDLGKQKGGQTRSNPKFGEYIVWPENISIDNGQQQKDKHKLLNATAIGKHFQVSSQRLNLILSELGWIEKELAGWTITKLGKTVGGRQYEHETSGGSYVLWPDNILQNKSLIEVFKESHTDKETSKASIVSAPQQQSAIQPTTNNFRDKFEAKHRTKDGHFVRSRAEVIIDDTLYDYGLVHAYEKKVPIEEELYTDFYLPNGKVYIEYWGLENDPKYAERKKKKIEIYQKYDLKLIELNDDDISNLDDHLPKKLLKYGIKVY
ncbi:MAG: glycerol kinase [Bacteroidetes bacterium]|nr:glycerol kinase [Bacteroidota bacterium]